MKCFIFIYELKNIKQYQVKSDIDIWCEEMGIRNYTINSKGEIDVDGDVCIYLYDNLVNLPYKFGKVTGSFELFQLENLITLKNCPDEVCEEFHITNCPKIYSLKGCPKKVGGTFYIGSCGKRFSFISILLKCKVKLFNIINL